jgi:universal stress protein A
MRPKAPDKRKPQPKGPEDVGEHLPNPATPAEPGLGGTVRLRRILVPIDFSDCSLLALDYATTLAHQFQARLILLHVAEPALPHAHMFEVGSAMAESNHHVVEVGRERLRALAERRGPHDLLPETLVRMGHAHSEIPDTARAMGADLIVVGTHGFARTEHSFMGSTAERVVRQAPCPVLTVRLPGPDNLKHPDEK